MNGGAHLVKKSELIDRAAGYVVCVTDGELLVVAQTDTEVWDFAGGGCMPSETPRDAAIRELHEETGLTVTEDLELVTSFEELFFDIATNQGWRSFRYFFTAGGNAPEDGVLTDVTDTSGMRVSPTVGLLSSLVGTNRLRTPSHLFNKLQKTQGTQ